MKLKFWLILGGLIEIVFGIGLVAITNFMFKTFGVESGDGAVLMARLFGGAFIFAAVAQIMAGNSKGSEPAVKGIILGNVLSNLIGFAFTLMAVLNDTMNSIGWLPVALYGVFAVVFIYFLFAKPAS